MALRKLSKISPGGDTVIAEFDVDVTSPERLKEIEVEYDKLVTEGYTAVDITDKRDEIVRGKFNPEADTLMIPRFQGGSD